VTASPAHAPPHPSPKDWRRGHTTWRYPSEPLHGVPTDWRRGRTTRG
jgi:hypothetical protein